jgi:uncharacterized protein (TIGR02996 family)
MSDEAAFLEALKANPADDTTRLVYADWLDEHGESAKAEYLRMVFEFSQQSVEDGEYSDSIARLKDVARQTDSNWRKITGARFDVVIEEYEAAHKTHVATIIRERTGIGHSKALSMAESVPTSLFSWLTFEEAFPHLLAFTRRDILDRPIRVRAAIRPTPWPEAPVAGAGFDVILRAHDYDLDVDRYRALHAIRGLATLLRIPDAEARTSLASLPVVVGVNVRPQEVAEFVRQLNLICHLGQPLRPGSIEVIPHTLIT